MAEEAVQSTAKGKEIAKGGMGVKLNKAVYDYLVWLMEKHPHTRDNDLAVLANYWHRELGQLGHDPHAMTAFSFLAILAEGQLTSPETIRRTRQKIQEKAAAGLLPSYLAGAFRTRRKGHQAAVKNGLSSL